MITIDKEITEQMKKQQKNDINYQKYFFPEMLDEKPQNFEENRQIGGNDSYIYVH